MSKRIKKTNKIIKIIPNLLIIFSLLLIYLIFAPALKEETSFQARNIYKNILKIEGSDKHQVWDSTPVNTDFSIVIPKIYAKSTVVANVDPTNSNIFLKQLKKGVAHAKGTALPGDRGNVYLFAHSTDAFYNVGFYNAVFYLIGKLNTGDEVFVYYKGIKYSYIVFDKRVVNANDTKYLGKIDNTNTLTLQTCYPPGTTLKRLVVLARQAQTR